MKLRMPLIVLALALPVATAMVVARFSLPGMLPGMAKKATELSAPKPQMVVPETLEEAKTLTVARLSHLQKLSQEEWDKERATIRHKSPPALIHDAVLRTQRRLDDLNAMKEEHWQQEKERLLLKQEKPLD